MSLVGSILWKTILANHTYRVVSLETGKPLHINDDDCDVSEPMPVDDDHIQPNGTILQPSSQATPNGMIAVIPVVRITASIKKTLKSRTITAATLNTYDQHFKAIMASYPDPFGIHSNIDLDPRLLTAACSLQTSRFLLYRHNLTPACRRSERRDALDRLVSVAQDTALYVQRSFNPAHMSSWAARVRTMAPAFYCAHIWRCILVLTFRAEYAAALTLLQVSAAVADLRPNNLACGRHLAFFLDKLVDRLRAGASKHQLENDEEMLAYVSADMQGAPESAWVWAGSEPMSASPITSSSNLPGAPEASPAAGYQLTERELRDWPGWDQIQRVLTQLLHESQSQPQAQQQARPPPQQQQQGGFALPPVQQHGSSSSSGHHLAPAPALQPGGSVSPAPSSSLSISSGNGSGGGGGGGVGIGSGGGGSSRISIKDIM